MLLPELSFTKEKKLRESGIKKSLSNRAAEFNASPS